MSRFYVTTGKTVANTDVSDQTDINDINSAVDAAFSLVAAEIDSVSALSAIPDGGLEGQVLMKDSDVDNDVSWSDSHSATDGDDIDVDTTALTGATIISDLDFNVTTDTDGHVTDANGAVDTRELTIVDLDTTATGANLTTMTDGSNADALHVHAVVAAHDPEDHTGTDITAAELEDLSDGSNADSLHVHAVVAAHDPEDHTDTDITAAELETLSDGSNADDLHIHATSVLPAMATGVEAVGGIHGLELSHGTDADHDITISIGSCKDSTNVSDIVLSETITKQIDAAWAASTGTTPAGGLQSGSTLSANTYYDVYLILKDSDDSVDAVIVEDTETLSVAGYTKFLWAGFVLTDSSSNIKAFQMSGNEIIWMKASDAVFSSAAQTTSFVEYDLSSYIPTSRVQAILFGGQSNTASNVELYFSLDGTNIVARLRARDNTPAIGDGDADAWSDEDHGRDSFIPFAGSSIYIAADATDSTNKLIQAVRLKR